jgi:hypothetical protein
MAEDTKTDKNEKKEKEERPEKGLISPGHPSEAFQDKELAEKGIYQPFDKVGPAAVALPEETEEEADYRKNKTFLGRPVPSESAGAASQAK